MFCCARPLAASLTGASASLVAAARARREQGPGFTFVSAEELSEGSSSVRVKCCGFHKKGLVKPGDWHVVTTCPPLTASTIFSTLRYFMNIRPAVIVRMQDARAKEASEGLSKSKFFERYGFVLLSHKTAMSAQDWDLSSPNPLGLEHLTGQGMTQNETPLSRIYAKELEQIIRELLPESKDLELDPLVVRRGPGTPNPLYNFAPHQDYGFTDDDWPLAGAEFRERFSNSDVRGLMVVNFWRPVLPMRGPVQRTPLAVCDPETVKLEDIVPIDVRRDGKGYTKMMDLAYDEAQRWYYYPDMTVDEVLVFKSFQYFKNQNGPELHTCFHTAFELPDPPPGAEDRQSCEYRARLWF